MRDSVDSNMDKAGLGQTLSTEQQDNWRCFQESKHLSMVHWKGPAVAGWLELAIGVLVLYSMQYTTSIVSM